MTGRTRESAPLNGVTIEGVDYVGKTLLARNLLSELSDRGVPAEYRKDFVTNGRDLSALIARAAELDLGLAQDQLYLEAGIHDVECYQSADTFFVQDRQWLSLTAHFRFFHPEECPAALCRLERIRFIFRFNIYLTSNLTTKLQRVNGVAPRSKLDRYLARHTDLHQRYDEYLRACLPIHEDWLLLDTSELAPSEVLGRALAYLQPAFDRSTFWLE